ncbi:MAG: ABC transporter substrate-binding protein [Thermotogae bacterium]|nr:ABC transporter substrate-binding protein [Thermotogota bacterium]
MRKYLVLVSLVLLLLAGSTFAFTEFHGAGNWVVPPAFQGNPWAPRAEWSIAWYVWEPLMYYIPASQKFVPCLATSMDVDANARTITAHLRKGVVWQDGIKFTSKDVLATFYLGYLKHWGVWNYLDSIKAPDDYTVVFHFKELTALSKIMLCQDRVKSSEAIYGKWADQVPAIIARGGDKALESKIYSDLCSYRPPIPVGTGPFKLKSVSADTMILDKFQNYWAADKVKIDRIRIYRWTSNEVVWTYVIAGAIDAAHPAASRDVVAAALKANPHMKYYLPSDLGEFVILFNCKKPPMSDVNFRKAVAYAVNADLVRKISLYFAQTAGDYTTGIIKSFRDVYLSKDFLKTLTNYTYNPKKAEEILLKAGYTKGADGYWRMPNGKPISLEYINHQGYSDWILGGESIITQLKKFGIKVEQRIVVGALYGDTIRGGKFDMAAEFGPVFWGYGSPWRAYNRLYAYKPGTTTGEYLKEASGVPDVIEGINTVKLTDELFKAMDLATQKAIIEKLAHATNEYLPYYSIYEKRLGIFLNDGVRVTGWPPKTDPIWSAASGGIERVYKILMQEGILHGVK